MPQSYGAPLKPVGKSRKDAQSPPGAKFPIVGIGASAGGLEAFTEALGRLPTDTGMAFVLVQHLSPQHPSFLTELMSKVTQMPVVEVRDGIRVEPNHVYVIPPNVSMGILSGALRLIPREEQERPHLTIDFFFRSLAQEQKNEAIGIILSGTGSDGAEGLKLIKGEGGISFAQSPESAKFEGMPAKAIAVDHVDCILSPEEIALELIRISRHPFLRRSYATIDKESKTHGDASLGGILLLVRQVTGVDFSHYKHTTVRRRIMRRMVVHRLESLDRYLAYLQENRTEIGALQNDMLISVTSFFGIRRFSRRSEPSCFRPSCERGLEASRSDCRCTGCATGEEAYSIAIALLEYLGDKAIKSRSRSLRAM